MSRFTANWGWIAPVASALAFVLLAVVFVRELGSFRTAVTDWARRDLTSRAAMAAATLREPLRTSDLPRLHAFGAQCEREGLRLTVLSPKGGIFFDSRAQEGDAALGRYLYAGQACEGYEVRLGIPQARVYAPFRRAQFGFLLSALAGASAVLIVFFVFYRQRIRITELTRLERFRREFVADVSHEIKTPLTGILGAVDLLTDGAGEKPDVRARLLGMVRKESVRLNTLVQQILDLARLEREEMALTLSDADLVELVRGSVARFATEAARRHVRLETGSLPPPGEAVLRCDAQRLQQALDNLLENALRHSGSPDIRVTLTPAESPVPTYCLTVEDHGRGVPPEEAKRIFERFHRVDPARAAETGGAGLGLAIVRQIARLHGGDVTLTPVAPHGCRFILRFAKINRSGCVSSRAD